LKQLGRTEERKSNQIDQDDTNEHISLDQLQANTLYDTEFLQRVETLLLDKGQIVFYGPPGTGKTFLARQFARYFVNQTGGDVQMVQFHPSYGYEEFIEGIRPRIENGQLTYAVEAGLFRNLCDLARRQPEQRHLLIVDEINRGNLPRIFGELLYLLEYRDTDEPIVLPYSRICFTIPRNVYVIGTMNTADRSTALVDHALRRRFHFIAIRPEPDILQAWLEQHGLERFTWLADLLRELNRRLDQDQIDWHLHIGHSHWMVRDGVLDDDRLDLIWQHTILPTLDEYFYSRPDRLLNYDYDRLRSAIMPRE
jgi:5-methylcytosine-specific restriction endonuclease McrBC GTP-binding regulatory subunit McrB